MMWTKQIMWIGILILIGIIATSWGGVLGVPKQVTESFKRVEAAADVEAAKQKAAREIDPQAGTTRSREYRKASERAVRETHTFYPPEAFPDFAINYIDTHSYIWN